MSLSQLPNKLTLLRLLFTPVLLLLGQLSFPGHYWVLTGIFILIALSDFFDGFLARRWSAETDFGRVFDPVADKLAIVTLLLVIMDTYRHFMTTLPIMLIILREIYMSGVRETSANSQLSEILQVSWMAKCKSAAQFIAVILLLVALEPVTYQNTLYGFAMIALYIATLLSLITAHDYTVRLLARLSWHT